MSCIVLYVAHQKVPRITAELDPSWQLDDVQSAIDLFLNDHGLEAVRHTEGQSCCPYTFRYTAHHQPASENLWDEDLATLVVSSSLTTDDLAYRAITSYYCDNRNSVPRWTAMLQSRWIRMLFDDSAALDARKTFKWIVFNQRNKHVDEGDGDVSDDEDDYWQDEETEDSQDGEEGGKGEDSSNRYELYDGW